ncbi:MAG: DUF1573 domain-containing protein [Bacteroidia bacterium]|nr:DUF1573 domain-containing protein [Bacteroidia bacterium]
MKQVLYILILVAVAGCKSNTTENGYSTEMIDNKSTASDPEANNNKDYPVITFDSRTHDFGDIVDGETVKHIYRFKNTGTAPLIINNCEAACGCTVPNWNHSPIKPGEESEITVEFHSSGKSGDSKTPVMNTKTVTINTNAKENPIVLEFTANVYPPRN